MNHTECNIHVLYVIKGTKTVINNMLRVVTEKDQSISGPVVMVEGGKTIATAMDILIRFIQFLSRRHLKKK